MNKKLLITAVGAALVAGSAVVNAAPTVYGKMNVGIASVSNGEDSTMGVTDDASRLGVKGDEDLGGGLKAIYLFEMALDVDNGGWSTGTGANSNGVGARDTYLGLQGGWGSVRVGAYNSAYKNLSVPLEIMGDTIGDFTHTTFQGETRETNAIGYTSPNFNGFSISVESMRGETGLDTESNPSIVALSYSMGPLYIGVGQRNFDQPDTAADTAVDSATKIAASFAFGAFKIWGVNENAAGVGDTGDRTTQHIGLSFTMGNNTFAATNTTYKQNDGDTADHSQMALAWVHALSKNTAIKVVNTTLNNDTGTSVGRIASSSTSSIALSSPAAGDDVSGTQVQLSTTF